MRYMLLISADESQLEDFPTAEAMEHFRRWMDDLSRRGVLLAHEGLELSRTATTVRVRGDQLLLTDGPYIEAKDQIGGIAMIEVDDLDTAIEIASKIPAASMGGAVEVRPLVER